MAKKNLVGKRGLWRDSEQGINFVGKRGIKRSAPAAGLAIPIAHHHHNSMRSA